MKRWKIYRSILVVLLGISIATIGFVMYLDVWRKTPDTIKIKAGVLQDIDLKVPLSGVAYPEMVETSGNAKSENVESLYINLENSVTFFAKEENNYKINFKLFGIIPFKSVEIEVIKDFKVIPAGFPIGIYVKTAGILVIDVGTFLGMDGMEYSPSDNLLLEGDYITKINYEEVTSKTDFMDKIGSCNGEQVILTVNRKEEIFDIRIQPILNQSNEYKVGIWIRDSAQGVGTMTFISEDYSFGALGHGINDTDTSQLMKLEMGNLYNTEIISITKGKNGSPGELTGIIRYTQDNIIGNIEVNENQGIFGKCSASLLESVVMEPMSIGLKQEIEIGPAKILACIDETPKLYDVEITEINFDNDNKNRGITLKVTDESLLAITGGIVQGMSGSPIIQNDKLIGAVTHVLVKDATRGYGTFIENMILMR